MNSRVVLLLFVICVVVGLISLKFGHQKPELQQQSKTSPISSPVSPPIARSATDKPNDRELPKSKTVNEPKPEEDTRNPVLEDDVKNNPLRQKTKSNRPISKKRLESLSSPEDMNLFLDDLRFDTLEYFYHDEFLRKQDPQAPDLNLNNVKGTFGGPVRNAETQQKIWNMRMQFDGFKKPWIGVVIEIAEDGQNYRHLPGYNYRNIDNLGFIVEKYPEGYLQMFYLPQKDIFIGNWYSGTFYTMKPKGTVTLQRVQ